MNEATKICVKCGIEWPATTEYFPKREDSKDGLRNNCKKCRKTYQQQYCKDNAQQLSVYFKQYREINAEKIKAYEIKRNSLRVEYKKQYWQKNKEWLKEAIKKYNEENAEKVKLLKAKRADKIKASHKNWRLKNKALINAFTEKRRTKKAGLESKYTKNEWEATKKYFNNKCAYCGEGKELTQDHFIPLSKGGEYTINNIVPVCLSCNSKKHTSIFFDWYPKQEFYDKKRELKILKYLHYDKNGNQQLMFVI